MAETATHMRAVLLADANLLIMHGVLAPSVIATLQGVNGYKNVMADLIALVAIHRKNADTMADRTSIKPEELKAAEDLAATFSEAVGLREQSPQTIAAATRTRQAAYTLFVTAYNEVRAAVQYLRRHENDANTIIPSLFAIHGNRKKSTADAKDKRNPPAPGVGRHDSGASMMVASSRVRRCTSARLSAITVSPLPSALHVWEGCNSVRLCQDVSVYPTDWQ